MATLGALQDNYHAKLGQQVVRFSTRSGILYPNFADCGSRSSVLIASGIAEALGFPRQTSRRIPAQRAGSLFENLTCEFIKQKFTAINHIRPGKWKYLTSQTQISRFAQYRHLKALDNLVRDDRDLSYACNAWLLPRSVKTERLKRQSLVFTQPACCLLSTGTGLLVQGSRTPES